MKIVYRAANPIEAQIVAGMLQAQGIEASASGTFMQGGVGELPASDFALVHVAEHDLERARVLLQEYDSSAMPLDWDAADGEVVSDDSEQAGWVRIAAFIAALALASAVVFSLF